MNSGWEPIYRFVLINALLLSYFRIVGYLELTHCWELSEVDNEFWQVMVRVIAGQGYALPRALVNWSGGTVNGKSWPGEGYTFPP